MQNIDIDILQVQGDTPQARFGHTLTQYSQNKAILFGGAVGHSGKFIITNECYSIDFTTNKWTKLKQQGMIPSQRAAHAACMIETNQIILYGGAASGGGGLSSDELYILDLRQDENKPTWKMVPTLGEGPGKRYGHSMVFFSPYLIVFGGNTGNQCVNDVWILNVLNQPYVWEKCVTQGASPSPRVYHASSLCQTGSAKGMVIVYGGRDNNQRPQNDCWGLRRHRSGYWDWCQAPYKNAQGQEAPLSRYQHQISFFGPLMVVLGGRVAQDQNNQDNLEVYDTETSEWFKIKTTNRYRHALLIMQQTMYVYGGFETKFSDHPIGSMLKVDLNIIGQIHKKLEKYFQPSQQQQQQLQQQQRQQQQQIQPQQQNVLQERKFGQNITNQQAQQKNQLQDSKFNQENINNNNKQVNKQMLHQQTFNQKNSMNLQQKENQSLINSENTNKRSITPLKPKKVNKPQKTFKLANQVIAAQTDENDMYTNEIQRIYVQNLPEEGKKLIQNQQMENLPNIQQNSISQMFIANFMKPKEWKPNNQRINLRRDLVHKLCDDVINILQKSDSLIRLRVPIKIFGSIYGRFNELLRFFNEFGAPCEDDMQNVTGDIEKFDYLFMGNYCDKGFNSIETLCLLFALKIKYPDQIHLLRGSHENRLVNKIYGFAEECALRFNEDISDPNSLYQKFNLVFEYMPLAAIIEDKIFCTHGGLSPNLRSVYEIEEIQRPINSQMTYENEMSFNLIENYYVDEEILAQNDMKQGVFDSQRRQIYGNTLVRRFLEDNNLNMMITANAPCFEGFQTNQEGNVISLNSCPDIAGQFENSGACIKITKNFQIVPSILNPSPYKVGSWINSEGLLKTGIKYTDKELKIKKRQQTPPRYQLNKQN